MITTTAKMPPNLKWPIEKQKPMMPPVFIKDIEVSTTVMFEASVYLTNDHVIHVKYYDKPDYKWMYRLLIEGEGIMRFGTGLGGWDGTIAACYDAFQEYMKFYVEGPRDGKMR